MLIGERNFRVYSRFFIPTKSTDQTNQPITLISKSPTRNWSSKKCHNCHNSHKQLRIENKPQIAEIQKHKLSQKCHKTVTKVSQPASPPYPNLPHETEVQKSVTTVTTVTNGLESKTNPKSKRFKNTNCHKSVTKLSPNSHNPHPRENSARKLTIQKHSGC